MNILQLFKNLLHPAGIASVVISLAIPFAIYLIPKNTLGQMDLYVAIPLFAVQTIAAIALAAILFKDFKEFFKKINPGLPYLAAILVIAVSATIYAGTQIEARHRVQSDESVFLSLAQNMYHNLQSGTCNQGEFDDGKLDCKSVSNSFKTKGLSWLYLMGMPFLGTDLHWAFTLQLITLTLTILLFFFALLAWTEHAPFALLATALLTAQPTLLFQFRSLSIEPLYILLFAVSLLLCKFAWEQNTWKHWALAALAIAFFAQTRQETVFCYGAFLLMAAPKILDKKDFKAPSFFVILSLFSAPVLITISYYQNFGFQGGEFEAHGHFLEDVARNWEVMTSAKQIRGLPENPFLAYFNYLFAVGGILLIVKSIYEWIHKKFGNASFALCFILLAGLQTYMILENVSGDFTIQINQRYSLVMFPLMAFLGAYPFYIVFEFLGKMTGWKHLGAIASIAVAVGVLAYTAGMKEAFNANIMYNRNHLTIEEHEIWNWLNEKNAKNNVPRYFIYARPYHFVGYGVSSIHYDRARQLSAAELQALIDKYNGEVYYIRGLDCWDSQTYHKKAVEHRIPTTCDHFERDMELVGEKNILITNNYWLQIAKFKGRKNYNTNGVLRRIEAGDTLDLVAFEFGEQRPQTWKTVITLNGKVSSAPYTARKARFQIPEASMPGYQILQVAVIDSISQKVIAKHNVYKLSKEEYVTKLNELQPTSHEQGWGSLKVNQSIDGNQYSLAGESYPEGLGIHWPSKSTFNVAGYDSLSALVGLDEESLCNEGGGTLKVYGDGKELSEVHVGYGAPAEINASLRGIKELAIVTEPKESKDCGHVDLVLPLLYKNLSNLPAIEVNDIRDLEIDDSYRK